MALETSRPAGYQPAAVLQDSDVARPRSRCAGAPARRAAVGIGPVSRVSPAPARAGSSRGRWGPGRTALDGGLTARRILLRGRVFSRLVQEFVDTRRRLVLASVCSCDKAGRGVSVEMQRQSCFRSLRRPAPTGITARTPRSTTPAPWPRHRPAHRDRSPWGSVGAKCLRRHCQPLVPAGASREARPAAGGGVAWTAWWTRVDIIEAWCGLGRTSSRVSWPASSSPASSTALTEASWTASWTASWLAARERNGPAAGHRCGERQQRETVGRSRRGRR